MTLAEIALMREALHERYRAESGKGNVVSMGDTAGYLTWLHSLTPLQRVQLKAQGRL